MAHEHEYAVSGGYGAATPGALGPGELDGRADWVGIEHGGGLLEALAPRIGSEVDLEKLVLAAVCPLRSALDGPPLDALLARLPYALALEVREGDRNLNTRVVAASGASDYLVEAARLMQHAPPRAALYVYAFFAAARAVLPPDAHEAIAARLPRDLAELWRSAR